MGRMHFALHIKMHRLKCHDCGCFRMEELSFISSPASRVTKAVERGIIELRKEMSIHALANYFDLHWDTVKTIEKRHLKKKYKSIKLNHVKTIGVDEVYLGKKGYLTIVRDLESGAVLYVGKGKNAQSLTGFIRKVKRSNAQIQTIAVDMAPSFTSWIQEHFPDALIVYDHFHVIKQMNDKLHNIRRRTMNNLEEVDKKALKNRRWHFIKNQENLNPKAAEELEKCKTIFDQLSKAHYLKESLRNIYSIADSKDLADIAFNRWCELAIETAIPEMKTMARTIKKHINGILAYWQTAGLSSAAMEGFNNKIGWLTRQAYGYRDEEYLILKIYDLPNLRTKKDL